MATQTATAHPLEPLAPAELARAGELVRGELPEPRFVSVGLHEPPKADYLAWRAGGERPARARSPSWSTTSTACTSSCAISARMR